MQRVLHPELTDVDKVTGQDISQKQVICINSKTHAQNIRPGDLGAL